jgi:hypothetical protein
MSYPKNRALRIISKVTVGIFIAIQALFWVIVGVWAVTGESFIRASIYQIVSGDLGKRGAELRAALPRAYKRVATANSFGALHGADVTEDVLPFIPVGTPFTDAVTILKSAGFEILPYPRVNTPPNPNRAKDWYALSARISPYTSGFLDRFDPIDRIDLFVSLLPPSPGEYTTVSKVAATFYRTSL